MTDERPNPENESELPALPKQAPQQQQDSLSDLADAAEATDASSTSDAQNQQQGQQNQSQQNQFQQQQQQFLALPGMPAQFQSLFDPPQPDFFGKYQPAANVYDEVFESSQNLRPAWQKLAGELSSIGPEEMEHRWKQIRRMVHQHGIAYSAYGDPSVRSQHLQLDPLPHLMTGDEWSRIESALEQRTELLNLLLADLYGPRKLLSDGVLPPDILFNHPHYHLPFHDLPTPGGKHLHFYAAEIIRSPNGNWWVKADRSGSPGGSGFTLENRIAISRAFPNAYRSCNVQRLAPYFIALRENLRSLAKTNQDNPRIAILTSGPRSSRYFEDSFLARYLGFTLVETKDLVVRSGRVMLKTLAGLLPIDVIFRRRQSNSLDPLELGGSAPGIPGFLQVIREGNVVVANAPGSGLVESPIFMAFMPRICQALMRTELKLPGVATWWGGDPQALQLMLDRIDEIHLLPAYRERTLPGQVANTDSANNSNAPKFMKTESMTREERISLLRKAPEIWVGQERVARSSSAVWENGNLVSGHISMRTFLTNSGSETRALPGGLVWVGSAPYESNRNPFGGGGTKDVWVLSDQPVEPTSLLKSPVDQMQLVRSVEFLPSRIADNLCWLGRYLERADALSRLLRAIATRLTGETDPSETVELPTLIRALALSGQIDSGYAIEKLADNLPSLEASLAFDALNHSEPNSLSSQVGRIVKLAGSVRDRLSDDAWRIVQEMSNSVNNTDPENCDLVDLLDTIEGLVVGLAAFSGFVSECMTRTHAFSFLNIGRRLEHSMQIVQLIKNCLAQQANIPPELLEATLEVSESGLTYRSRYYENLTLPAVLDLLLADESNPRSLAYQLRKLLANLRSLPEGTTQDAIPADQRLANEAIESVQTFDIVKSRADGNSAARAELIGVLANVENLLSKISTEISNRFFVHSGPAHRLIVAPENEYDGFGNF